MTLIAPHFIKSNKKAILNFFKQDHFFTKTPWWLKKIYPNCLWDIYPKEKILYLSFDDGPHPTITPFVLELLKQYNAKASFFCIGENVNKYPQIFNQVITGGHAIGNHTQNHVNGWETTDEAYLQNILEAQKTIDSKLFRPPYGRMKWSQIRLLNKKIKGIKIVMWNILAGDWIEELTPEKCFENIKSKITDGDIIVLHDSEKAFPRMSYVLPKLLKYFTEKGYCFKVIH